MGVLKLPRRLRCSDIPVVERHPATALDRRRRPVGAPHGVAIHSSAYVVPMPLLDSGWLD